MELSCHTMLSERAGTSAVREACADKLTAEIGWKETELATKFVLTAALDDAGSLRKPSLRGRLWESPPRPGREQKIDGRDALIANPSIEALITEVAELRINVQNKSAYIS